MMVRAKHWMVEVAETHGLTMMQMHLLILLTPDKPVPMNKLSVILECDASNVTGIVDRLESHNLIRRTSDPKDRRVKMISPTPTGSTAREMMLREVSDALQARVNAALSPTERTAFYAMVAKLQDTSAARPT